MDAIFATQEALLVHLKNGGKPYLCFYDMEKAFDSIELPILLRRLYDCGVNGKLWRIIKSWYSNSTCRVKLRNSLSDPFQTSRGVKQGSVLSPTLFLTIMDLLLGKMRESNIGLSVRGMYTGPC